MAKSKWDPVTRSVYYDPAKVAERLRYWAEQHQLRGLKDDPTIANDLLDIAYRVEAGLYNVKLAAKDCIKTAERFCEEDGPICEDASSSDESPYLWDGED